MTQEERSITRGKTNVNKFENEVALTRNDLAVAGYLDKNIHGVWTLTETGKVVDIIDKIVSDLFKNNYMKAIAKHSNDSGTLADSNVDIVRYWIYAPGQNAEKWEECYKKGIMLLGWGEIEDWIGYNKLDRFYKVM